MSFVTLWVHQVPEKNKHHIVIEGVEHPYVAFTIGRTPILSQATQGVAKRDDFGELVRGVTFSAALIHEAHRKAPSSAPVRAEKPVREKRQKYPQAAKQQVL